MVENKTIAVVSVRSGTSATSTRQVHLPEDVPSLRRGPPEPVVQNSNLLNEDTVTSTLEENEVEVVANKDVNIVNDKRKSSNVGEVEASASIAETDLLSGEAESKRLMKELFRETLKEELTRDLK
ncbi:hypothetical protein SK128_004756, partial [Halocaridina rubra]